MNRDGALTGYGESEDDILAQSRYAGDKPTIKRIENSPPATLSRKVRGEIIAFAKIDGSDWAAYLERQLVEIFKTARMDKQPLDEVQVAVRSVFEAEVEPLPAGVNLFARRVKTDAQREADRKYQANKRIWRKQQKQLADWEAGKTGEPPWRLKARQNVTRMRTGWNRWYTNQAIERAESDSAVVAFKFSLGRAANHTDTCMSREGFIVRKGSAAEQANRPPLHWGCKSKYIPLTKAMMKKTGVKFTTAKDRRTALEPDAGFGGGKALPK